MSDWLNDTGLPWPETPIGRSYYSQHHYRDGMRIIDREGPFRLRDKAARWLGFHCWECFKL